MCLVNFFVFQYGLRVQTIILDINLENIHASEFSQNLLQFMNHDLSKTTSNTAKEVGYTHRRIQNISEQPWNENSIENSLNYLRRRHRLHSIVHVVYFLEPWNSSDQTREVFQAVFIFSLNYCHIYLECHFVF